MITTEMIIKQLPNNLAAYERYIRNYECGIAISPTGLISLIFYKNGIPYVLVVGSWTESPVIYCNREELDMSEESNLDKLNPQNIVTDINTFLTEIRKCDKSDTEKINNK